MFLSNRLSFSIVITFFLLCIGTKAKANITVKNGWNELRSDNISITTNGSGKYDSDYTGAFLDTILAIKKTWPDYDCDDTGVEIQTINGYTGLVIKPGVLLVIYNSTLAGQSKLTSEPITTTTITWNEKSQVSKSPSVTGTYCYDIRPVTNKGIRFDQSQRLTVSGTVKTGIYVTPGTVMNSVKIPDYYVSHNQNGGYGVGQLLSSSGLLLDANLSSCTLSVPTSVSFGTVSNDNNPVSVQQNITVNCSGTESTYNVDYSMTSKSGTATKTTLPMTNTTSKNKVADIRGFLNANSVDAGCMDKDSSILMNGTEGTLITGAKTNVNEVIPVSWVLCPVAGAEPGPASATATMEITW